MIGRRGARGARGGAARGGRPGRPATAASAPAAAGEGSAIRFTFDGAPRTAAPGTTIAGALIAGGVRAWRTTRVDGAPRGAFCGIGICFDCLVVVNGVPNRRACLEEVRPGDAIETQRGAGRDDLAC